MSKIERITKRAEELAGKVGVCPSFILTPMDYLDDQSQPDEILETKIMGKSIEILGSEDITKVVYCFA